MLKKPNTKSITKQGATIGSAIVGGALSDGIVGLVPDDYKQWGKPAFALACAIASASIKDSSTGGQMLQGAFLGMSIKQGLDSLREMVLTKLPEQDANTQVGAFANKVLGLSGTSFTAPSLRSFDASAFSRQRNTEQALASPNTTNDAEMLA